MIKQLITEFPLSDVPRERSISREKITKYAYTKDEVDALIDAAVDRAVAEARRIDEESMAKHNREATVISMILGFTTTQHALYHSCDRSINLSERIVHISLLCIYVLLLSAVFSSFYSLERDGGERKNR